MERHTPLRGTSVGKRFISYQMQITMENIYFKSKGLYYYHMEIPTGSISVHENAIQVYSIKVYEGLNGELEPVSRAEFLKAYTDTLTRINNLLKQ